MYYTSRDYSVTICLSVTRRYAVETAKRILKIFSPSGSHTKSIPIKRYGNILTGTPSIRYTANGGADCRIQKS